VDKNVKKNFADSLNVLVLRAPGMHSGRGVAASSAARVCGRKQVGVANNGKK